MAISQSEFDLSSDQQAIRQLAREVSEKEFRGKALHWEGSGEFPWSNIKTLAKTGLLGATIPEAYGGSGGSWLKDMPAERFLRWARYGPLGGGTPQIQRNGIAHYLLRESASASGQASGAG